MEEHKIEFVLAHHARKFKRKKDFNDFIQFHVIDTLAANMPLKDQNRLKFIMDWVKGAKRPEHMPAEKPFTWAGQPKHLQHLSELLFDQQYTHHKNAFRDAIDGIKTEWKKDPVFLIYLIYKLHHESPLILKISHVKKGYLIAIDKCFYEKSGVFSKKDYGSRVVHEILNRPTPKLKQLKDSVDKVYTMTFNK